MSDCLFCKILNKEIPATLVYEDEEVLAFNDIVPKAPIHVLIIPKKHIAMVSESTDADQALLGRLIVAARKIAVDLGVEDKGYRLVINNGADANQTVFHIHLHLMAGRSFTWPPG